MPEGYGGNDAHTQAAGAPSNIQALSVGMRVQCRCNEKGITTWMWGTLRQLSPQKVQLDGAAAPSCWSEVRVPDEEIDPKFYRLIEKIRFDEQQECYSALLKILGNIIANPTVDKFRRVNATSKLLQFAGSCELMLAIGFTEDNGKYAARTSMDKNAHVLVDFLQAKQRSMHEMSSDDLHTLMDEYRRLLKEEDHVAQQVAASLASTQNQLNDACMLLGAWVQQEMARRTEYFGSAPQGCNELTGIAQQHRLIRAYEGETCAICLEPLAGTDMGDMVELPCKHAWHKLCWMQHLDAQARRQRDDDPGNCPMCRQPSHGIGQLGHECQGEISSRVTGMEPLSVIPYEDAKRALASVRLLEERAAMLQVDCPESVARRKRLAALSRTITQKHETPIERIVKKRKTESSAGSAEARAS